MLRSLRTSCRIWEEIQISSVETWRVYRVLSSMLETLDAGEEVGSAIPEVSSDSSQLLLGFKDVLTVNGEIIPLTVTSTA
jgi:predicted fused transcriptional regulator/phosphomethylpyrimidine kinase